MEIVTETFESMTELLAKVLGSVQRFETVYAIHNYKAIELWNDQNVIRYVQTIYEQMGNVGEEKNRQSLEELVRLVKKLQKPRCCGLWETDSAPGCCPLGLHHGRGSAPFKEHQRRKRTGESACTAGVYDQPGGRTASGKGTGLRLCGKSGDGLRG